MTSWFDRFFSGLYREVLPRTFDEAQTLADARLIEKLLRLRRGKSVLDVPCGMGRISIPLAKRGLQVTGVDLMADYIARAKRDAKRAGVEVRFIRSDMRRIDFDSEFDGAFNWFGSFGYFSERDNLAYVRRMLAALKPGGRFLVEGIHKPWLLRNFIPDRESTVAGIRIRNHARFDARTSRIHDAWTLSKGGRTERQHVSMRIYSGPELRRLFREAGFAKVELYGNRPFGKLTQKSARVMCVGIRRRAGSTPTFPPVKAR